jgi:hypothetical protein
MSAQSFRVTTPIDQPLGDDIEVLEAAFPSLKGKPTELLKKAFELAARVTVESHLAALSQLQADNYSDDEDVMAAQLD